MRYILIACLLICGCSQVKPYVKSVQEDDVTIDDAYEHYVGLCEKHSDKDELFVDQCFVFDCTTKKFRIWDYNCNQLKWAYYLRYKYPHYFE